ncbi:glycosyl transferase family 1 [Citrobacter freundii]|uniref:HVO_A0114 family putative DNA-binding protein n=1 Tax=Citrobacter freundii TaxID=546 RepID=UPI00193AFEA7|nr:glycosyl transferase family 1 [Citrobacter freundii]MBM3010019.1 glycosyl transferase family 1 [Citrobacter freundii]MCT1465822.1 glycosyl transferase family 1 [Citrobacter freundii]MCT1493983.1 glycosyl transferase family 1 [Citrobacter freundii]
MKTVTIKIETMKDFAADVMSAMNTAATGERGAGDGVISFPSWAVMHKVLAPNRMAVIQAMAGRGELTIREIAALVGRDVKGVHTDVIALVNGGLLERGESGTLFPYDAIHFDFTISAAA